MIEWIHHYHISWKTSIAGYKHAKAKHYDWSYAYRIQRAPVTFNRSPRTSTRSPLQKFSEWGYPFYKNVPCPLPLQFGNALGYFAYSLWDLHNLRFVLRSLHILWLTHSAMDRVYNIMAFSKTRCVSSLTLTAHSTLPAQISLIIRRRGSVVILTTPSHTTQLLRAVTVIRIVNFIEDHRRVHQIQCCFTSSWVNAEKECVKRLPVYFSKILFRWEIWLLPKIMYLPKFISIPREFYGFCKICEVNVRIFWLRLLRSFIFFTSLRDCGLE